MNDKVINVVMMCFNRKIKTENCVKSLLTQRAIDKYKLNFFICDDGSTDGTSEVIKNIIPDAHIVIGTGNLFWAKGMAKALDLASQEFCDFYLMVNDDVVFLMTCFK